MGHDAEQSWRARVQDLMPEGLSQWRVAGRQDGQETTVPSRFSLDGADYDASQASPGIQLGQRRNPCMYPVELVWHSFAWAAACEEVRARFGEETCVHLVLNKQQAPCMSYSMMHLYVRLFHVPEPGAQLEQWRHELEAVHDAVHEKVTQRELCPVCAGARLWQDARWHGQDWNFGAVRLLWEAVVDTINEYGTGWSAWRPVEKAEVQRNLPPKLQMENIPLDQVEELPEGVFK